MASFYSSEGQMLPTAYLLNQKLDSYPSSEFPDNKAICFPSQPSVSSSYPNLLSGSSIGSRDETVLIPPSSLPMQMQQIDRHMNINPHYSDGNSIIADARVNGPESMPQYHGLSLSLGVQEPSLVQLPLGSSHYANSSLCSILSSNMQSELHLPQNPDIKNSQYLSFDLAGKSQDTANYGTVDNQILFRSKYLKAAQNLLDELVNVRKALKQSERVQNLNSTCQDGSTGTDLKMDEVSTELHEATKDPTCDLSPSERHDLLNKVTKLLSMLDEVDGRYRQYRHHLRVLESSFDMVAGRGAAQPYTALAFRTISCHFRCLRDAIKKQIQATQKSLGENDVNSNGVGVLSRLRYVDQQLRQQKALQQFGVMRQPWRPQRGLPETAVSVLRAWLFEHFLHPYPKDSEKLVLARQTGLTRSQVANWFINARVRLWKPMIEEMYKEEFGDAEAEARSSSEYASTAHETSNFDDREDEYQGNLMSVTAGETHRMMSSELRPNVTSSAEIDACRTELRYQNGAFQGNEVNFGLAHLQNKQIVNVAGSSIFSDNQASANKASDVSIMAAAGRHNDRITDGATGNRVSLALGLLQSEKESQPVDKMDYYYVDPANNQHRFANANLLSDFVS